MNYAVKGGQLGKQKTGCLILGYFENSNLAPSAEAIDLLTNQFISSLIKRDKLKGKAGELLLLEHVPTISAERILLIGLGDKDNLSDREFNKSLKSVLEALSKSRASNAISTLAELEIKTRDAHWVARQTVVTNEAINYQPGEMKSKADSKPICTSITLFAENKALQAAIKTGISEGKAIASGIQLARKVSDLPGNICTPTYLAEQAITLGKQHKKLKVTILEEKEMEKLGMGALLSVSRGSREPAKLITMEYKGGSAKVQPIVLVGKGLTFDAGGISLKPGAGMDEMKYDMCGGASVLGTLSAIAEMQLPINVVGIIPSSENLPDGDASKPGDIVTSMSGLTIEVLNTDAEGRLILCDALTYAERFNPKTIIDIATLTGAVIIALGRHPSGLMGNDDELCAELTLAGEKAGDRLWRLPLWDEYQEQLKSNFADLANIGGRDGGTITAGCFLSRFTEKQNWAHIDIAGTAWKSGHNKGATGRPVSLLTQFIIDRANG
ncbi:MAG: leucyl aminopeptidase [Gammaproteobacteria bacterium]|nr:MAG: leucyl aminopeptidase [Gammaproteobacteria bacterium]